jgi:6-pyruvoyl-tetrahydropterin synthase
LEDTGPKTWSQLTVCDSPRQEAIADVTWERLERHVRQNKANATSIRAHEMGEMAFKTGAKKYASTWWNQSKQRSKRVMAETAKGNARSGAAAATEPPPETPDVPGRIV